MSYTIGRLAKKFGLSRSTLLYYDSIGLLRPEGRVKGEYRYYDEKGVKQLELVCRYRNAGLSLKEIKRVLDSADSELAIVLERRLEELNIEIAQLHEQRDFVLRLLKNKEGLAVPGPMNREIWTSLLTDSGFSEEDMRSWHQAFERRSPEKHRRFLEFLRIPRNEIELIRAWCTVRTDS